jgi:DNA-binding GntR family transcriptional regulator
MPTDKLTVSFRVSRETKTALEGAAERYGLSQTAVFEQLVHMLDNGYLTIIPGRPKRKAKDEPTPRA